MKGFMVMIFHDKRILYTLFMLCAGIFLSSKSAEPPRSDTPVLERSATPVLERSGTPLLEGSQTPLLQETPESRHRQQKFSITDFKDVTISGDFLNDISPLKIALKLNYGDSTRLSNNFQLLLDAYGFDQVIDWFNTFINQEGLNEALITLRAFLTSKADELKLQHPLKCKQNVQEELDKEGIQYKPRYDSFFLDLKDAEGNLLIKGKEISATVDDYDKESYHNFRHYVYNKRNPKEVFKDIVNVYKIHLMPFDRDLISTIKRLQEMLIANSAMQGVIFAIKVLKYDELCNKLLRKYYGKGGPRIVIYISGTCNTQFVLNEIYKIFGNQQGLDLRPDYNEKVTTLIYFAQGDRDDKENPFLRSNYFDENSSFVYFQPSKAAAILGGKASDYNFKLVTPAQQK